MTNSTITVVKIDEKDPKKLLEILNNLDSDQYQLYFESEPDGIIGRSFEYEGNRYIITSMDIEENEEPLLEALMSNVIDYDTALDEYGNHRPLDSIGYYTEDEAPNRDFQTDFDSHTNWRFTGGNRYAWNIPNIANGTLVGFYWIPISAVLEDLLRCEKL
jgi:hypothetical protein